HEPQAARRCLISERGVDIAVAHDDPAGLDSGPYHLRDELGPRRREEQGLASRCHGGRRILEQSAHLLPHSRAARLAHRDGLRAQRIREHARLGRLARAVDALEGHEESSHAEAEGTSGSGASRMARRMRALVTGGAGFIGSNVVDALLARGDQVTVVDDLSTGRRENLDQAIAKGAELVEADIRDADAMVDVAERARPEAVFHLAAQIDVRKSTANPGWEARINVEGTINMLEAARAAGARRFVNTSSGG